MANGSECQQPGKDIAGFVCLIAAGWRGPEDRIRLSGAQFGQCLRPYCRGDDWNALLIEDGQGGFERFSAEKANDDRNIWPGPSALPLRRRLPHLHWSSAVAIDTAWPLLVCSHRNRRTIDNLRSKARKGTGKRRNNANLVFRICDTCDSMQRPNVAVRIMGFIAKMPFPL